MVATPNAAASEPRPEIWFRRRVNLLAAVRELWNYRELMATLVERDLRVRYKQSLLGVLWALITPVLTMIAFTLLFTKVTHVNIHAPGVPYVLFSYLGLIPWTFFAAAISSGANSLISNVALLNKLYCPREVFPLSALGDALFDAVVASGVLMILFLVEGFTPKLELLWVPVVLLPLFLVAVAVALTLAALTVHVRDLALVLPLVLQVILFATPVAYPTATLFSDRGVIIGYCAVNPLVAVLDSLRRTVLLGQNPDWLLLGVAGGSATLMLCGGYAVFKRMESGIADVA